MTLLSSARNFASRVRFKALSLIGTDDYVKFIVLARSRTGTNWIRTLVNTHPNALLAGEILQRSNGRDPITVVRRFFSKKPGFISAAGFKVFYYHPIDGNAGELQEYLASMPDLRVVHVHRRNKLKVALSRKIAESSGVWLDTTAGTSDTRAVTLDKDEIQSDFEQTEKWEEEGDKMFSEHPLLDIWYEDMQDDPQKTLSELMSFLDLEQRQLSSPLKKQNSEKISDTLENYDELKAHFAGTRWESFFTD